MSDKTRKVTLVLTVDNLTDEQIVAVKVDIERLMRKADKKTGIIPTPLKKLQALTDAMVKPGCIPSYTCGASEIILTEPDVLIRVNL